jgi:hypothetical protein
MMVYEDSGHGVYLCESVALQLLDILKSVRRRSSGCDLTIVIVDLLVRIVLSIIVRNNRDLLGMVAAPDKVCPLLYPPKSVLCQNTMTVCTKAEGLPNKGPQWVEQWATLSRKSRQTGGCIQPPVGLDFLHKVAPC